ncbi:MAG: efflux RND transporter periplasmic adaptor subunit [Cyanobacteria bacterium J06614_10]
MQDDPFSRESVEIKSERTDLVPSLQEVSPAVSKPDPLLEILSKPPEKRRYGTKWIALSGLVFFVGLAGWAGYRRFSERAAEPVAIQTMTADLGDLEVTVTESGTVELGEQQTFKSPSDVTVEAVWIEERQQVSAGTVLLELRDRTLQKELNNQQVEFQKLENTLNRKREIIQERQDRLQTAQERLQESQSLFDRGFISEDAFRQDEQGVDDALSALKDAEVELTNTELDVRNNQLAIENALVQLADNKIVSPIDAVVLNVDVKPGDGVTQGNDLLTIGDPNTETVRLQLTTLNAAKVKVNMPVEVSVIGPNPQAFAGRISRVSPQVDSGNSGSGIDGGGGAQQQGSVEAEAILAESSEGALIPGSGVSVEVILDRRESVVIVPLTAIQQEGDRQFVWVKDDLNQAQKRPVSVGLQNLQSAEISSGLAAGEAFVPALPPGVELTPGMPLSASGPSEFPMLPEGELAPL